MLTASGAEVIHSHLVYFLVPLPEPLGLPDKYLIECGSPTSREQYLEAQMAGRPMPPPLHIAASVVFHRYTSASSSSQEVNHLFALADQEGYSPGRPEAINLRMSISAFRTGGQPVS